jgi:hypothetical protein
MLLLGYYFYKTIMNKSHLMPLNYELKLIWFFLTLSGRKHVKWLMRGGFATKWSRLVEICNKMTNM